MSVLAFYPSRGDYSATQTIAADSAGYFICDSETELPANANDGDRAYTKDSDVFWNHAGGRWLSSANTTARQNDGRIAVMERNFRLLLSAWLRQGLPMPPGLEAESVAALIQQ